MIHIRLKRTKCISGAELHVIFRKCHVISQLSKTYFRLDHPKLGQMSTGMRVLGPEGWTKCINIGECTSVSFYIELTRNSEPGSTTKKILVLKEM
jgi:hypothetical protein